MRQRRIPGTVPKLSQSLQAWRLCIAGERKATEELAAAKKTLKGALGQLDESELRRIAAEKDLERAIEEDERRGAPGKVKAAQQAWKSCVAAERESAREVATAKKRLKGATGALDEAELRRLGAEKDLEDAIDEEEERGKE